MNTGGELIGSDGRKRIILLDTTLRDGHQCPGAGIERDDDYFNIVRGLDGIGFNICEVGFPSSSKHEGWRVNRVAQMCRDGEISTIVGGLTQMVDFQVNATLKALDPVASIGKGFFHIYFPVDPALRNASIGSKVSDEQALKDIAKYSKMASDLGLIVQFSPEGYSKVGNNFDFCTEAMIAAAENGVTFFNMPDTIGGQDRYSDEEYYVERLIRHKKIMDERFPGNSFVYSVHNHNDLGTAVDNSIAAVLKGTGISKIEGTINGIGERAGNADLNQVIVRMKTTLARLFNIDHINAGQIIPVSQMVSRIMLPVQPNYPIVGSNAMRHTSGGHTNAMIKDSTVYQPFNPSLVGGEISLVYGPNSGGNLAIDIISKKGYICPAEDKRALDEFLKKRMVETGRYKGVTDDELLELYFEFKSPININNYTKDKADGVPGMVRVTFYGTIFGEDGLVLEGKTVFLALQNHLSQKIPGFSVGKYDSRSEKSGADSKAETTIEIRNDKTGEVSLGIGRDDDTEIALLKALSNAFNKIYIDKNYKKN